MVGRNLDSFEWDIFFQTCRSITVFKQECNPVGCVPAAHWPYAGVCFLRGVSALGGCLLRGVTAPMGVSALGVVSAPGGCLLQGCLLWGGWLLPWGICSRRGVCSQGVSTTGGRGVSAPRGLYPSMHWGRPPTVDRITDKSKNIALATTSLRSVNICWCAVPHCFAGHDEADE